MEDIASTLPAGDEADVESEGGTILRNSKNGSLKDAKITPKSQSTSVSATEVLNKREGQENEGDDADEDDEDDDADEETYAVEKVLDHRIGKKQNVTRPKNHPSLSCMLILWSRVNWVSDIISNGLAMISHRTIRGKMRRIVRDQSN
jgi:hypothetical protein